MSSIPPRPPSFLKEERSTKTGYSNKSPKLMKKGLETSRAIQLEINGSIPSAINPFTGKRTTLPMCIPTPQNGAHGYDPLEGVNVREYLIETGAITPQEELSMLRSLAKVEKKGAESSAFSQPTRPSSLLSQMLNKDEARRVQLEKDMHS